MSSAAEPARVGRVTRTRLYEQIVEQLVQHIRAAGLGPGDRLPPERELAASLGVSRATLAQALVALEVLGTISVRHGEGAVIVTRPGDGLVTAVREHRSTMPDIIDARSALETKIAALAARRRTQQDLDRIDGALELMAAQVEEGERGLEGDQAFHEAVTQAARSGVLARLMREIAALIRETRIESLSTPGRPQDSLASHREIAEAIRAQDPRAAAQAMEDHIVLVSDVALLRDAPDPG